ncbi:sporulation protein YabP [Clostridium felsineum]|uniref:Spore protein YabP n=1 Tax=Clostridium felsineum TaxID=36839 RepID=A0A1S8LG18_9CLOT|nr:sporulation protein YabP [Clostridium felsineum]MCR3760794.1 sporulation protein YabP [Clostridium felsineum]URZ03384.1 Spore protein YabP [Clostridium felsineum]URZ08298.1 Spore protein YabP [Clostridium felsineum]URZ13329.1 Spore protein YabP [Clostridium felsineum]
MEVKKELNAQGGKKSLMTIENRKRLLLTGVSEVVNFNDEQIVLNTNLGALVIKGRELKMNKLDVQNGDVAITGTINACVYSGGEASNKKDSIISRLFK